MIIREFRHSDFDAIKALYKESLNFDMDRTFYDYLYKIENGYCSLVCEYDNQIIGHNALISKEYCFQDEKISVGLSSGGMVKEDFSGVFFKVLRNNIKNFTGDCIIAFPNKNSEPFFTKLLKFESIKENYFGLKKTDFTNNLKSPERDAITLCEEEILKRIHNHPRNEYVRIESGNTFVIYKVFHDEIDLIYVSDFNSEFLDILKILFKKNITEINLITDKEDLVDSIGFKKKENNVFTYKWLNQKYEALNFNVQMIDSDVF